MKKHVSLLALFIGLVNFSLAQDDCSSAMIITPGTHVVDAVNGTEVPATTCSGAQGGADMAEWYSYTPDADYYMTVSSYVVGIDPTDTRLHIYSGPCDDLMCVGGADDNGPGYSSIASLNVTAGVTYTIVWDNYWTAQGFTFTLTVGDPLETVVNFTPTSVDVSAIAVLDMNGDFLDDVVESSGENLKIAYQQTDGSFETETIAISGGVAYQPGWSICGGDMDGNGYNDLVFAGSGASFIWANSTGTAYNETSDGTWIFCQRSNMVDINMDGNLDVFVCHDVEPNVFYINNGTQLFQYNQGGMGDTPDGGNYGSVWIDYDNDCDIDMFIAKCRGGDSPANINQMHRNNGDGTYTEVGEEIGLADDVQTWSSAWGDYDNDGDMDVLVGASSFTNGGHKLMINDGNGFFTDETEGSGWDTYMSTSIEWAPADFNNDGLVDVIGGGTTIMINNGDLTFSPNQVTFGVGPMGDLNHDGFIDVVNGGTIYMNVPNGNNYIALNLVGTESNKNGLGARVTITTPSGQQIRDVRSGEGFRYMSTLNTHFGIGEDESIESISICWPSGITDVIENPAINQTLLVTEGENAVGIGEQDEATLELFPNPATTWISCGGIESSSLRILDLSGKLVANVPIVQNRAEIDFLAAGMYLVRAQTSTGWVQQVLMKQ